MLDLTNTAIFLKVTILRDTLRDFLVDWNPGSTRPSHGIRVFSTGGSGTDFDRTLYSNSTCIERDRVKNYQGGWFSNIVEAAIEPFRSQINNGTFNYNAFYSPYELLVIHVVEIVWVLLLAQTRQLLHHR